MKAVQLGILLFLAFAFADSRATDTSAPVESPHAQAIRLVMQARASEIEKLDSSSDWWHDTKERTWSAKRPFGPGVIDSTHFFNVTYAIEGSVVGTWAVNTRTGQVSVPGEPFRIE